MKLTLDRELQLPTGVLGLAASPDGGVLLAACADGTVNAVDLDAGKSEPLAARHDSYASGVVLLPDGRTAVSAGYDGALVWHDLAGRRAIRKVAAHGFWSWQLALSPDGRRVASTTGQYAPAGWKYEPAPETEPSVRVFDTATGECVASFSHLPPALSCAWSPDGTRLAAANLMGEVRVWDVARPGSGPVSHWTSPDFTSWGTTKSHHYSGGIYALAFSPDGAALVGCGMGPMGDPMAGNGKMTWQRWDWRDGKRIDQVHDGQHGSGLMEALAWHPDGRHFVMAGRQAQGTWNAAVFAASDGGLVQSLDTKKRITQARFVAGGTRLLLAGANGQPGPKDGKWPAWGRVQRWKVEA